RLEDLGLLGGGTWRSPVRETGADGEAGGDYDAEVGREGESELGLDSGELRSDRPGWTRTEEDWRWVMTLLASGEKEMRLLWGGRGLDDAVAAARAERRSPVDEEEGGGGLINWF
ncbi:hypothetical protein LINPERPRIM_LOCUS25601, partial [Linum perenne]